MLGSAPVTPFVPTTDPDRARRFYVEVLGLELIEERPFGLVFDALRVIRVPEPFEPQPFTIVGWTPDDLEAAMAELASRGVEFLRYEGFEQDAAGVWVAPSGTRVAWFRDPDGNVLSLSAASRGSRSRRPGSRARGRAGRA